MSDVRVIDVDWDLRPNGRKFIAEMKVTLDRDGKTEVKTIRRIGTCAECAIAVAEAQLIKQLHYEQAMKERVV